MIPELLGGASSSLLADPKISFNGPPPSHHAFQSSSQPSSTPSSTPNATATNNPPPSSDNNSNNNSSNNLRCPRCDSANTKFCYYNNYNLTQPRHFCKTCRRYWTKGGALRNVPIGGGCRKNKSTIVSSTASKSTSASSKLSKPHDDHIARAVTAGSTHLGFDHDLMIPNTYSSSNPNNNILWGSASPQPSSSSHILALLRATSQNPNPNTMPSHLVKEENNSNNMVAPHMMSSSGHQVQPLLLNGRAMGLDHLGHQLPSLALSTPSFWRTNAQNQPQLLHQNGTNINALGGGEVHNSGMQELYQRLIRSSSTTTPTTNDYFTDHHHHHHSNSQPVVLMSNAISSSSSSPPVSSMLEPAPVAGDQLGYGWNVNPAAFSWSDLPTTNGAYP